MSEEERTKQMERNRIKEAEAEREERSPKGKEVTGKKCGGKGGESITRGEENGLEDGATLMKERQKGKEERELAHPSCFLS